MTDVDHLAPRPPPTRVEVMLACETLLRAGYTVEGLTVLAREQPLILAEWAAKMRQRHG